VLGLNEKSVEEYITILGSKYDDECIESGWRIDFGKFAGLSALNL